MLPTLFLSLFSLTFLFFLSPTQFVLGEQSSSVSTENLAANDTGDFSVTGDTSGVSFADPVLTINGGSPTISMATEGASTTQRIEVTGAANITLNGVNISTGGGPALEIEDDATFAVNITLQDGSENTLVATSDKYAGLQKNGDTSVGMLTITGSTGENAGKLTATGGNYGAGIGGGNLESGSAITISGGEVKTNGGHQAAGIGGGYNGSGSNITISGGSITAIGGIDASGIGGAQYGNGSNIIISGGTVTATGGDNGAGIGGGNLKSGSNNRIDGDNVVVIAESGSTSKDALEGFDAGINKGLIFTKQGSSGSWSVDMYSSSVDVTADVTIPADLTVEAGKVLTVDSGVIFAVSDGITLDTSGDGQFTVASGGTLQNDGTIADNANISGTGNITTRTHFYLTDATTPYGTDDYYQTYMTGGNVQKYKDLPNPDASTLAKTNVYDRAGLADESFAYWYYLNTSGVKVPINDTTDVLLNQHTFYEETATVYNITISSLQNGSITTNKAQAAKDETVTLTVTPDEGYQLQSGTLKVVAGSTEVALTDKGDGTYTFSMPEANVVVSATFEPVPGPDPGPGPDPTPGDSVTLTFRTDEGSWNGITETTLTGAPDATIIAPVYPTVDASRTCIGWFDEQGNQIISGVTTFGEVTGVVTARFVDTPGWHQNNTGWWYVYDLNNNYYTNCWALINSSWFYFNDAGYCLEYTWGYINGEWYFFGWGGYMQTGWQWLGGSWYFLDRNTGAMKCGWVHDGVWYYCDAALGGAMYDNCWAYINGNWYGFNEGGSMTQGWSYSYSYDGWFYLDPETGHMLYGWQYIGGHWYYFYDNGLMAANTYVGTYRLGADGIWK